MKKIYSKIALVFLTLIIPFCVTAYGQNGAIVLEGAIMKMRGGTETKPIYICVDQESNQGIVRNGSGHIVSEEQYNFVKWNTLSNSALYTFPFGYGVSDYIPFEFNKSSASNSQIIASTWATNQLNTPYPGASSVNAVSTINPIEPEDEAIDRFWDVRVSGITNANLNFNYRGAENTTLFPDDDFYVKRWDGAEWSDYLGDGQEGVNSGVGSVGPILNQNAFSPYVLVRMPKDPVAIIDPTDTVVICQGETVTFTDSSNGSNINAWIWNFDGGIPSSSTEQGPHIVTFENTGTFIVTLEITDDYGTGDTSVVIIVKPNTLSLSSNSSACENDTLVLYAGAGIGADYQWTGPEGFTSDEQSPVIDSVTVLNAGTYYVTAENIHGCISIDSIVVSIYENPNPVIEGDTIYCVGDMITLWVRDDADSYLWSNDETTKTIIEPATAEGNFTYSVTVTNGNCSGFATYEITVNPNPVSDAGNDTIISYGDSFILNGKGGEEYFWSPPDFLSSTNIFNPETSPERNIIYTLEVTNEFGCKDKDSIRISLEYLCGETFIPNAFRPGSDNEENMVFKIYNKCITNIRLEVFNSWGNKVFSGEGTQKTMEWWDGTFRGQNCDNGPYSYSYAINLIDGNVETGSGTVLLIR